MTDIPYERKNIEWRPVIECPDYYEVSNYGDVKRLKRDFIDMAGRHLIYEEKIFWSEEQTHVGGTNGDNYLGIHINRHKTYAHRVAAMAFIPNLLNKPEVNHKDGNTKNNYCGCKENNYQDSNLEWVTRKENMKHASENGLINHESLLRKIQCKKNREKVNYEHIKRPVIQIEASTGKYIAEYESIAQASKETKIGHNAISSVARRDGYHKTAGGYNWVYKDEYDPNKDYTVTVDLGSGNRKPVAQCDLDWNIIKTYKSPMEAERLNKELNFNNKYIRDCANGKRKTHKGYKWRYI